MKSRVMSNALLLLVSSTFILFAETAVFQNGLNGYTGCMDSWILENSTTNNGNLAVIKIKGG